VEFPPGDSHLARIRGILGKGRAERLLGQGALRKARHGLVGRRDPLPPLSPGGKAYHPSDNAYSSYLGKVQSGVLPITPYLVSGGLVATHI